VCVGSGRSAPTLLLSARDARASGFAGCNQFTGRYELSGDALRLGPLAMTRMACPDSMDLEQRYSSALEATRTYRIKGSQLELLAGDRVVAVFQQS
jgi:heat shock protein HslJ